MYRRVACLLALLAFAACSGVDPISVRRAIEAKKQGAKADDVAVPPQPDLERTGRVGLKLSTNSRGWETTLHSAAVDGAVVLLVAPGSPAERAGFVRGDVVTRIGGSVIRSDERALVGFRARPGVPLRVTVARGTGSIELEVVPGPSFDTDFSELLNGLLARSPGDATNLLLRAQTARAIEDSITDVNRTLEIAPDLVDALVYRARLFWSESLRVSNEAVVQEDRRRASDDYRRALQIDPDATAALKSRATGALEIGEYFDAEQDALQALEIDPTLPSAYYIVAAARYASGKIREAVPPAGDALRLDPYDADSYRLLALAFDSLGRDEDARETVRVGLTVATDENQRAALRAVLED